MSSRIGSHRSYLLIDHGDSPGVPAEVLAAYKRPVTTAPAGVKLEVDTWTCSHCQGQVVPGPTRTRPREVCFRCMRVVCDRCKRLALMLGCQPFEEIANAVLAGRYYESPVGLILSRR